MIHECTNGCDFRLALLQLVQVVAEVGQGLLESLPLLGLLDDLVGLAVAGLVQGISGHDLEKKYLYRKDRDFCFKTLT